MPVRRFLVLLGAARRRRMREQLLAMDAAAYPHLRPEDQHRMWARYRDAMETQEEREARWADGWDRLGSALVSAQVGRRTGGA